MTLGSQTAIPTISTSTNQQAIYYDETSQRIVVFLKTLITQNMEPQLQEQFLPVELHGELLLFIIVQIQITQKLHQVVVKFV